MNLVSINVYGSGYYSGRSYDETIFLLEEDYKKLNIDLENEEVYLGELDGKHSEVYGEIEVEVIEEDEQEEFNFEVKNDGKELYWFLSDEDCFSGDLDSMIVKAKEYIGTLDSIVNVSYKIKKSKVEELNKFVESLEQN